MSANSAAKVLNQSAEGIKHSADDLLSHSYPPMARHTGSSRGRDGQIDFLLEEPKLGELILEPLDSPIGLHVLHLRLLLVAAPLRRKYWRFGVMQPGALSAKRTRDCEANRS